MEWTQLGGHIKLIIHSATIKLNGARISYLVWQKLDRPTSAPALVWWEWKRARAVCVGQKGCKRQSSEGLFYHCGLFYQVLALTWWWSNLTSTWPSRDCFSFIRTDILPGPPCPATSSSIMLYKQIQHTKWRKLMGNNRCQHAVECGSWSTCS